MEKQLEFDFNNNMGEISNDALNSLKIYLELLKQRPTITNHDLIEIVSLCKWISEQDIK